MIAGMELGKEYVQLCVKTPSMKDAQSVTKIAGTEHYRIPTDADLENEVQLQECFRKLWKMLSPYGNQDSLEALIFCMEDNSPDMRKKLLDIVRIYNISAQKVHFLDKLECFCAYVMHQSAELLTHNALLIENHAGSLSKYVLHKRTKTLPVVTEIHDFSENTLEELFADHAISSVFLVGDDYEEDWLKQNLSLLKTGKRVFLGKNLYVKGACYYGMDLREEQETYLYLGKEKVCCHVAIKAEQNGMVQYVPIAEGGKNWYESNGTVEVLLLDEPELEFALIPINGKEKQIVKLPLEGLPKRPKKTTRLRIELTFTDASHGKLTVTDLGFGALFARSDMVYEGELEWEQ